MILYSKHKQAGLTLLELLISMTVGVMLITGIIQLMANNKQNYLFQRELARMQENGRYALTVLRQDIQMAGIAGCSASSQVNNLLDTSAAGYSDTLYNLGQAVGGWEYTGSGTETAPGNAFVLSSSVSSVLSKWKDASSADLDSTLQNKVVKGTDVLVVKSTEPAIDFISTVPVTFPINATSFSISTHIEPGKIVVISSCSSADLFRNCAPLPPSPLPSPPPPVKRISCVGTPDNNIVNLSYPYELLKGNEDATIAPVSINSYYVGIGQNNAPTLYRKDYSEGAPLNAVPLVEGVESMQVLYGIDTSGNSVPNQYVTAAALGANADNVVSVRISLILRSLEEVEEVVNNDSLIAAETTLNSVSDRYLRKAVSTTIQLRNRGI
ncbi:MAG: PilW family protein [Pseudomonadales bacterium]|nr:PilW family protein [Pseudomonadales bacterium]